MSLLIEIFISENFWEIVFELAKILIAFLFGLFSSFLIHQRIKKNKLRRIREFYISWINYSLESVDRQIVLYSNQIKDLSESKSPKFLYNNNQLHRLDSINNEELFDAFVLNNKGKSKDNSKNLHRLVSHIDFVLVSIREVKEKVFDVRIKKDVWNEKWNKKVIEFHSIIFKFVNLNTEVNHQCVDQIKELKLNLNKSYNKEEVSHSFFIENYVHPVKSVLMEQVDTDSSGLCHSGIEISETLNILLIEREELYLSYKRYLDHYERELKNTTKKIKEIINYFEEQK